MSVRVSYPATWEPRQVLLLWEALVLGGIPDADTEPVDDSKPPPAPPARLITTSRRSRSYLPAPRGRPFAGANVAGSPEPRFSRSPRVRRQA